MAIYRLIYRGAGTGDRISALTHLEFRVWVQYQLTADDYGVCPAEAVKLQGDNVTLQEEPQRRIQAAIERLIAVGLCGVFQDGRRRYLYQADWQDRQRIRHFTATSFPPIPPVLLAECSTKTRAIFAERFRKDAAELPESSGSSSEGFPLHARACDAHADATASGSSEGGVGETAAPGPRRRHASGPLAGSLPRDHIDHGWCGVRFCVNAKQFHDLARRYGTGGETAVTAWLGHLDASLGPSDSPGGPVWVLQHFDAWLVTAGRMKPVPRPVAVTAPSAVPGPEETRRISEAARARANS